jgi:hypothetical protein
MEIQGFEDMPDGTFRRLTGVRKRTFSEMSSVLEKAEARRKAQGGKPNRLAVGTRLLMMLEYWREYRTYLHIAHSYGVSESTAYRNICWCEDKRFKIVSDRYRNRRKRFGLRFTLIAAAYNKNLTP